MTSAILSWAAILLIAFGCYKLFGWWVFGFVAALGIAIWFFGPLVGLIWFGLGIIGLFFVFWVIGMWRGESDRQDAYRYLAKKLREEEGRAR
jgi:hypothetical protein